MKKLTVLLFIIFSQLYSQKGDVKLSSSISISKPILDDGTGFGLALNTYKKITSRFYLEGQVSGIWTKINSSFLQGNKGNVYSGSILAGPNYYFKSNIPMVYFNFLAGLNYSNEKVTPAKNYEIIDLGISTGLFLKLKKITIGFGLESPQNMFLKLGFNLK